MWGHPNAVPPVPEHPDAFADALASVNRLLPEDSQLTVDGMWGDPPHVATATFADHVVAGRGETAAAALRDLARQLRDLSADERGA